MALNVIFVDLQGYKISRNYFLAKEIFFMALSPKGMTSSGIGGKSLLLRSPFEIQRCSKKIEHHINWLKTNYHGLDWNDGQDSFGHFLRKFERLLFKNRHKRTIILVKGRQKIKWLRQLLASIKFYPNIRNIEDMGFVDRRRISSEDENNFCASLEGDAISCNHHDITKFHCAKYNVYRMKKFLEKYKIF